MPATPPAAYAEARAAARAELTAFRERSARLGRSLETPFESKFAEALAILLEPVGEEKSPEQVALVLVSQLTKGVLLPADIDWHGSLGQVYEMLRDAVAVGMAVALEQPLGDESPSESLEPIALPHEAR